MKAPVPLAVGSLRALCRKSIQLARNAHVVFRTQTRSRHANRPVEEHEQLFNYTSGRWLWDEQARLDERYKAFDVQALKDVAIKASGARKCRSITKIAEGRFSKVFRLIMDNGSVAIARIPMPVAGPLHLTVASEVATMDLVSRCMNRRECHADRVRCR